MVDRAAQKGQKVVLLIRVAPLGAFIAPGKTGEDQVALVPHKWRCFGATPLELGPTKGSWAG